MTKVLALFKDHKKLFFTVIQAMESPKVIFNLGLNPLHSQTLKCDLYSPKQPKRPGLTVFPFSSCQLL